METKDKKNKMRTGVILTYKYMRFFKAAHCYSAISHIQAL